MTIKKKLTSILIIISLILASLAFLTIWSVLRTTQQINIAKTSINYLHGAIRVHSNISLQIMTAMDYLISSDDEYLAEFEDLKLLIDNDFKLLKNSVKDNISYGFTHAYSDMEKISYLKKKYKNVLLSIEKSFYSNSKEYIKNIFAKGGDPWLKSDLLRQIDVIMSDGIEAVDIAYERVLVNSGTMPWIAEATIKEVKKAISSIHYFLTVDRTRSAIYKQMNHLMRYILSRKYEDKVKFEKYGLDVQNSFSNWYYAIDSLIKYEGVPIEDALEHRDNVNQEYDEIISYSLDIFKMSKDDSNSETFYFIKKKIDPILKNNLFKQISLTIKDSKKTIERVHIKLHKASMSAGTQAVTVLFTISLLTILIIYRLTRNIIKSLDKLKTGTNLIGSGILDHRISLRSGDELQELALHFNNMTETLEKTTVSRDYVDNIFSSMIDTLIVLNDKGEIKTVNEAACKLLGYTNYELIGTPINNIIKNRSFSDDLFSAEGKILNTEDMYLTKNKIEIPVSISCSMMYSKNKKIQGVLCVAKDITKLKIAEAELKNAYNLLKNTQSQLVHNEKMASLGQLIAGIAHEINTPIGAIFNVTFELDSKIDGVIDNFQYLHEIESEILILIIDFLKNVKENNSNIKNIRPSRKERKKLETFLLNEGVISPSDITDMLFVMNFFEWEKIKNYIVLFKDQKIINLIENIGYLISSSNISRLSAEKITNIIKALKYYAYTDMDKVDKININESIANTLILLKNKLKYMINIETVFDENIPIVNTSNEINQIWTNLINNAYDAIMERVESDKNREGIIKIFTYITKEQYVGVKICDNGYGIKQDLNLKVFDPFFTTKDIGKGTGLGLSIVSGIIKKIDGRINFESNSEGTCFEVLIPL